MYSPSTRPQPTDLDSTSTPDASSGVAVSVAALQKSFGARRVLHDLDLTIRPGEFLAIVGHSGCGKSTLLRLLANLDPASSGSILLDGTPVARQQEELRLMFQDARLLPWKSVWANVTLGLKGSRADLRRQALEALNSVGLAERADDWPSQLSGGQRQRVALARALIHKPRLLLLDEPLGALDALTRIEMQGLIERLWLRHGFTAVLVTHDVTEAVALADRVILIEDGAITLDQPVALARPRERGEPAFADLEQTVLNRVLRQDHQADSVTPPAQPTRPQRGDASLSAAQWAAYPSL